MYALQFADGVIAKTLNNRSKQELQQAQGRRDRELAAWSSTCGGAEPEQHSTVVSYVSRAASTKARRLGACRGHGGNRQAVQTVYTPAIASVFSPAPTTTHGGRAFQTWVRGSRLAGRLHDTDDVFVVVSDRESKQNRCDWTTNPLYSPLWTWRKFGRHNARH
jgi:hypothetical protein